LPIISQNHIHFYLKLYFACREQKIGTTYGLEISELDSYKVCKDKEKKIERIEQDLSLKIRFVLLTRVSHRPVNDCMLLENAMGSQKRAE